MPKCLPLWLVLVGLVAGCGDGAPKGPPTDPVELKKIEENMKKEGDREGGSAPVKKK